MEPRWMTLTGADLGCLDCGAGPFPMVIDLDTPDGERPCPECGNGGALVWWDDEETV
jgi:hypothetical protein